MPHLILPASWVHVMTQVRSVMPSAFLAGGALRDLDNMRPVKDFDVFFTEEWSAGAMDEALKDTYAYHRWCPGDYLDAAKEVLTTYTYESLEGLPTLNFVQLDKSFNPADIILRVDFGLCQIGYDLLGVTATEAYERDKANQCLTLTRAETVQGVQRSLKRYQRLSEKYRGWSLVIPDEFKDIVTEAVKELHATEVLLDA